jgi:hypothetical protein
MDRRIAAFVGVGLLVVVGGALLLVGLLRGDETSTEPSRGSTESIQTWIR